METPTVDSQRVFAPGILRDQVAIITGGATGIGLATALEMIRCGAAVAICGRSADKLAVAEKELAPAIVAAGGDPATKLYVAPHRIISPNGFLAVIKNNLVGTFHMCRE